MVSPWSLTKEVASSNNPFNYKSVNSVKSQMFETKLFRSILIVFCEMRLLMAYVVIVTGALLGVSVSLQGVLRLGGIGLRPGGWSQSRGFSVQEGLHPGGLHPGGLHPGASPSRESPSRGVSVCGVTA